MDIQAKMRVFKSIFFQNFQLLLLFDCKHSEDMSVLVFRYTSSKNMPKFRHFFFFCGFYIWLLRITAASSTMKENSAVFSSFFRRPGLKCSENQFKFFSYRFFKPSFLNFIIKIKIAPDVAAEKNC